MDDLTARDWLTAAITGESLPLPEGATLETIAASLGTAAIEATRGAWGFTPEDLRDPLIAAHLANPERIRVDADLAAKCAILAFYFGSLALELAGHRAEHADVGTLDSGKIL